MISDSDLLELKDIITSDYGVSLDIQETRSVGDSLINIYSALIEQVQAGDSCED